MHLILSWAGNDDKFDTDPGIFDDLAPSLTDFVESLLNATKLAYVLHILLCN